jgi:hypothetical protein
MNVCTALPLIPDIRQEGKKDVTHILSHTQLSANFVESRSLFLPPQPACLPACPQPAKFLTEKGEKKKEECQKYRGGLVEEEEEEEWSEEGKKERHKRNMMMVDDP